MGPTPSSELSPTERLARIDEVIGDEPFAAVRLASGGIVVIRADHGRGAPYEIVGSGKGMGARFRVDRDGDVERIPADIAMPTDELVRGLAGGERLTREDVLACIDTIDTSETILRQLLDRMLRPPTEEQLRFIDSLTMPAIVPTPDEERAVVELIAGIGTIRAADCGELPMQERPAVAGVTIAAYPDPAGGMTIYLFANRLGSREAEELSLRGVDVTLVSVDGAERIDGVVSDSTITFAVADPDARYKLEVRRRAGG